MKKNLVSLLTLFLLLVFFSSGISVVFAQDDGDDSDVFMLEEVTVTAAKQGEQDLQKVPIAMEVITGEDFAVNAQADVDDILSSLAGVFINTMADGMRVSIRGMTDTDGVMQGRKSSSPTVALNVDGAYNSMNNSGQNLFDVERIEVLMGPQSTLYASNSPGGVVNIITASPKTDRYSASLTALYGSYEHSEFQATLNAPIIQDRLAMRLAANRTRENNFLKPYTDELATKNDAVRLKVLWDASDTLDITMTGNYSINGNRGEMTQQVELFGKASGSSDWTASENAEGTMSSLDQKTKGVNVNVSWDSPVGNLSVEPSYNESDGSGDQDTMLRIAQSEIETVAYSERITKQEGAEARLASPEDFNLQYVVGLFYYENTFRSSSAYYDYPSQDSYTNNDAEQKAVYGNLTYPLPFNEKLALTVGYRQSWDWNQQSSYDPGRSNEPDITEMDESNPDYKVGFEYDMDDQTMFFGSYTSSFRTDGMSMTNNVGQRPAEDLKAYTVGAKTRMLGNRLQLNTTAYYYDYKNRLAQDAMSRGDFEASVLEDLYFEDGTTYYDANTKTMVTIADGTSYLDFLVSQGAQGTVNPDDGLTYYSIEDGGHNSWGNQRTIGIDASISWVATSRDMVEFSVSYLDKTWTDLTFVYLYTDFYQTTNYDGHTAPNAPKFSMTASYEHKFDIGSYGVLTPHVDVQHKTGFDLTFDQSDGMGYAHQEAYYLYNASLGFTSASQKWSVNAVVKNITNYAVKKSYTDAGDSFSLLIGDPRTYSITASVKF